MILGALAGGLLGAIDLSLPFLMTGLISVIILFVVLQFKEPPGEMRRT